MARNQTGHQNASVRARPRLVVLEVDGIGAGEEHDDAEDDR
jgi:hypothetical protein